MGIVLCASLFCCWAKEEKEAGGGGGERKESGKQRERKEGRGDMRTRRGEGNRRFEIFNSNSMGWGRGPNTADSFIGNLISLTSKSEIHYEGILYTVDTDNSNIALQNGVLLEHFGCWKPVWPPVYFTCRIRRGARRWVGLVAKCLLGVNVSFFLLWMGCWAGVWRKLGFPSLLSVLK